MKGDRCVLVTGAGGGIGRAACDLLAGGGWSVLAVDRDAAKLDWIQGEERVMAFTADIATPEGNEAMVAEAERRFGGLEAIVLNAGVAGGGSIDDVSFEDYRRIIEVNLFGPVLGIKASLPLLRRRSASSIVVTASAMGVAGDSDTWAYSSSKHGVIGLVRSLARELACEGIRINALCPGLVRATGLTAGVEAMAPDKFREMGTAVPLARWGEPTEMAEAIAFLASEKSSYVNGQALVVDGGASTGTGLMAAKRRL